MNEVPTRGLVSITPSKEKINADAIHVVEAGYLSYNKAGVNYRLDVEKGMYIPGPISRVYPDTTAKVVGELKEVV